MAIKTPRRPRRGAVARMLKLNPIVLALSAVAAVFIVGFAVGSFVGKREAEPPRIVAQLPAPKPPAPVALPKAPVVAEQPPLATEPEPGMPVEEADAPASTQPTGAPAKADAAKPEQPRTTVAMLPPPVAPVTPPSGIPLWRKNAVPATIPPDKPAIAIVIDDMGLDRKHSAEAVRLPGPVTLSWLPYAHDLPEQVKAARAAGHEALLHLPMEPSVHADPGPNALLVSLGPAEVLRRTRAALDSFTGYVGVNNHMGSRFTADAAALEPVLAEFARRGLLWLDSRTTPKSAGVAIAQQLHMPYAARDIFLDNTMTVAAVREQLAKTERVARHQGYAIAIGHPHPATLAALAAWLPEARKQGFVLVPVSAVVKAHYTGG